MEKSSVCHDPDQIDRLGLVQAPIKALNWEKLAGVGILLLLAYVGLTCVLRAAERPFGSDEIITIGLVRLPSLSAIRDALGSAADSQPPPFYVAERLASRLPINELIAFRIPSIVAFCCSILCIFLFVKKARGSTCALLCATLPLLSVLSSYALSARGYSLMAGFAALAMVSYQRADKPLWCVLLGISLMAATASHYYGVFAAFPFALAELVLLARERHFRLGVWIAVILSVLPVAVFWRLLQSYKSTYGTHFAGSLSPIEILKSYGFLWNLPVVLAIGVTCATLAAIIPLRRSWLERPGREDIPLHEDALAIGLIILPVVMVLAIKVLHGGFLPRYVVVSVLGFALAAGYAFSSSDRRIVAVFSVLLLATLGAQELSFWRTEIHALGKTPAPAQSFESLLTAAGHEDLPVVVSGPNDYLQLAYYASPRARARLFFAADPKAAAEYVGVDIGDKCLLSLRPYMALQVKEFSDFTASHKEFLVYSDDADVWDWLPTRLLHDRYQLEVAAIDNGRRVYFVYQKG